jgi:hypothetical protein
MARRNDPQTVLEILRSATEQGVRLVDVPRSFVVATLRPRSATSFVLIDNTNSTMSRLNFTRRESAEDGTDLVLFSEARITRGITALDRLRIRLSIQPVVRDPQLVKILAVEWDVHMNEIRTTKANLFVVISLSVVRKSNKKTLTPHDLVFLLGGRNSCRR